MSDMLSHTKSLRFAVLLCCKGSQSGVLHVAEMCYCCEGWLKYSSAMCRAMGPPTHRLFLFPGPNYSG